MLEQGFFPSRPKKKKKREREREVCSEWAATALTARAATGSPLPAPMSDTRTVDARRALLGCESLPGLL